LLIHVRRRSNSEFNICLSNRHPSGESRLSIDGIV
jgi:hypothetical protein